MNREWISKLALRATLLAGALGPAGVCALSMAQTSRPGPQTQTQTHTHTHTPASASARPQGALTDLRDLSAPGSRRVYSVVNLGANGPFLPRLNERGEAAYFSFAFDGSENRFFDGDRTHPIAGLGGPYTLIRALNNNGVVAGESVSNAYPNRRILAFSWSLGTGPRELPGQSVAGANDINDAGVIVGYTGAPGVSGRAARWNPDGSLIPLRPLPAALSNAYEVNADGYAVGFASYAGPTFRASLWAPDGTLADLGGLGGDYAFALHINARGDVAGQAQPAGGGRDLGFFWSSATRLLPIDIRNGSVRIVADLNDKGEVALGGIVAERRVAHLWSQSAGLVQLPMGDALQSDVNDLNHHSEMVGNIELQGEGGNLRAVRWPGVNPPIDLNTRMHRPPAGLVLQEGVAINDRGTILARSNAGLVLLRPGTRGTDAPVLGPILGLPDRVEVGQQLNMTIGFVDNGAYQTHTATATVADGCAASVPVVSESGGVGEVRLRHTFCAEGLHTVRVRVSDSGGRSTEVLRDIVVGPVSVGSVSGMGVPRPTAQSELIGQVMVEGGIVLRR